jgi:hypothetical protein
VPGSTLNIYVGQGGAISASGGFNVVPMQAQVHVPVQSVAAEVELQMYVWAELLWQTV